MWNNDNMHDSRPCSIDDIHETIFEVWKLFIFAELQNMVVLIQGLGDGIPQKLLADTVAIQIFLVHRWRKF